MTDTLDTELPGKTAETEPIHTAAEPSEPMAVATPTPTSEEAPGAVVEEAIAPSVEEASAIPAAGQAEAEAEAEVEVVKVEIEGTDNQNVEPVEEAAEEPATQAEAEPEAEPDAEPIAETQAAPTEATASEAATNEAAQPAESAEGTETGETGESAEPGEDLSQLTQADIVARLQAIAADPQDAQRTDIDALKQAFYKLHNAALEAARLAFTDAGGDIENYVPTPDPLEPAFREAMATIKAKRGAANAELEKQKELNYQTKLSIIEKLKALVESRDDANKNFNEFKKLQQQWNEIKLVPQNKVNELWKSYQHYAEQFYDLLKLNNAFREYDFKKNLAAKTLICETAERLAQDPDVVSAFHQLQKLHQQFRETGPVSRDLREQVWARFKAASTAINRRHQQHFEALKEAEQNNLDQKTAICEIIESVDYAELKTFNAWENKTKEIIALQAKWKTIGFAPQKMNVKIFERYRHGCDEFFKRKAEFFKALKEDMNANLEKKRALCEQAEALKESTDWRATAAELSRLQKEWKAIGPVAKKHSDAIWKRFIGACDYFYDRKGKATSSQRSVEQENLQRKREVISQLQAIDENLSEREGARQVIDLIREWNSIGHVPFRDKDKLYKQYRALVDHLTEVFSISPASARQTRSYGRQGGQGQQGAAGSSPANRERDRLARSYEAMKAELQTYENNLGFLTASSSRGSSLVDELKRKAAKLKADIDDIKAKIQAMDAAALADADKEEKDEDA